MKNLTVSVGIKVFRMYGGKILKLAVRQLISQEETTIQAGKQLQCLWLKSKLCICIP